MSKIIGLAVILSDGKIVQASVLEKHIIAIQEDPDDNTRSYVLLSSGHDMHVDLDYESLYKIISGKDE